MKTALSKIQTTMALTWWRANTFQLKVLVLVKLVAKTLMDVNTGLGLLIIIMHAGEKVVKVTLPPNLE